MPVDKILKIATIFYLLIFSLEGQELSFSNLIEPNLVDNYNLQLKEGLAYFKKRQYKLAEKSFHLILKDEGNVDKPIIKLLLAKTQYHLGKVIESKQSCRYFLKNFPGSQYKNNIKTLLGDLAIKDDDYSKAFELYLGNRPNTLDSLSLIELDNKIIECIANGLGNRKVEELLFSENNDENRLIINLARGYQSILNGDKKEAILSINLLESSFLHENYNNFFDLIKTAIPKINNKQINIALVLPLSGKNNIFGEYYLLGVSDMFEKYSDDIYINIKVYDNNSDDIETLKIIKGINKDPSIKLILGHFSDGSDIASVSSPSAIPILVSNTNLDNFSRASKIVFLLKSSIETEARFTARYLVNALGYKNIAVISSGENKNKKYANYFVDELFNLGVDPVAIEWFYGKPENISKQFKNIRKVAWDLIPQTEIENNALGMSIDSIDALFDVDVDDFFIEEKSNIVMNRKDSTKVVLDKIEGIYMPINQDDVTYLGTQFPMYNLKTKIFGNSSWNNLDLINQDLIGPHIEGLNILSSININIGKDIDIEYRESYAMGYDQAIFVNKLIKKTINNRLLPITNIRNNKFLGEYSVIDLNRINLNENGILKILEYNKKDFNTIGYFNGENIIEAYE